LLVRFAYGLRLPLPIACGVARVPLLVYVIGSGISSIIWSLAFSILGWALGRTTQTLIGHVRRWEPFIGAAVILSMVVGFVIVRRRRVAERTAHVIDPDAES
jgi:membrane protein DedA with SNARE-associated domain